MYFNRLFRPFVEHSGPVTHGLFVWLLLVTSVLGFAQTPVVIAPVPKIQFFNSSGRPLASGCVFSYVSGTTTALPTYTDFSGTVQNTNPIILDSGGFAGTGSNGIWLEAGTAYRLVVKSSGGTNCSLGSTLYTVDGLGGGVTTLSTTVPYSPTPAFPIQSQNQLFIITLTGDAVAQNLTAVGIVPPAIVTFEIIQDSAGGHSFTWPSNSVSGALVGQTADQITMQTFIWDGSTARAIGPGVAGQVPALSHDLANFPGDINAVHDITAGDNMQATEFLVSCTHPATVGTFRLCSTSDIEWRNNANTANQGIKPDTSDRGVWSFAGGLLLNGSTPDIFLGGTAASFPRIKRNSTAINFRLADDSGDAAITAGAGSFSDPVHLNDSVYAADGPEVSTPTSPAGGTQRGYFKAGKGWCAVDSSGVEYCTTAVSNPATSFTITTCHTSGDGGSSFCAGGAAALPFTQPDTSYNLVCTLDAGRNADSGSCTQQNSGNPCPLSVAIYNKTTTTFGYIITLDRGVSTGTGGFGTLNCTVSRP